METFDIWTSALVSAALIGLSLLACYPLPPCASSCGHESDADASVIADDEDLYDDFEPDAEAPDADGSTDAEGSESDDAGDAAGGDAD